MNLYRCWRLGSSVYVVAPSYPDAIKTWRDTFRIYADPSKVELVAPSVILYAETEADGQVDAN